MMDITNTILLILIIILIFRITLKYEPFENNIPKDVYLHVDILGNT